MRNSNALTVLGLALALIATDAHAGWSWKKKKPAPAPEPPPAPVVVAPPPPPPPPQIIYSGDAAAAPQVATFDLLAAASPEVRSVAKWVATSRDNARLHYLLLDKVNAQVYFFGPTGHLLATAPVLLGMGKGDRMLVSNATEMPAIPPSKRITPAGRFLSRLAPDAEGKEVLILDYEAALSLHPIAKGTPVERRASRLASLTADDNRISFGCINVPKAFYSNVVSPSLANAWSVVYILPETSPAHQLFGFQPDPPAAAPTTVPAGQVPATPAAPGQQVSTAAAVQTNHSQR